MKPFRFADKPVRTSVGIFPTLKDGEWLAQSKPDGWRAYVDWDGKRVLLTSRHKEGIPASRDMIDALTAIFRPFPPMLLDGEWMSRRDNQPEHLYVFDMLTYAGVELWNEPAWDRWQRLCHWWTLAPKSPLVSLVEARDFGYAEFFEHSKTLPGVEGIVLKLKTSRFVGSVRKSIENPQWLKVKWRDGADGQVVVA